jgi:uncharacterized protein YdeI (YjbR/CyaY-like superfamily)
MKAEVPTVDIRNGGQWRRWLENNHKSSAGVWLVYHKDHTGVSCIGCDESVNEALCFGWVDRLIKRLDEDRYARKFTPRSPTSKWSESNRKRWAELKEAGLLSAAGLRAAPTDHTYARRPEIPDLPSELLEALDRNPKARKFFHQLTPTYRRHFVMWIHMAKRPETKERRIRESVALLAAGKKLGLK